MAALLFGLLLLIVAGLTAVLGVGWLALIPALVAIGVVAWGWADSCVRPDTGLRAAEDAEAGAARSGWTGRPRPQSVSHAVTA